MRPASSVSSVIFLRTSPTASPPWLDHATRSPFVNSLMAAAYPRSTSSMFPGVHIRLSG